MTRIIAGAVRGHPLRVPQKGTRPTSERVREAMFSRLEHLGAIDGARVLDLYSGSGALGIEALSRGAASAVFVETNPGAARISQSNLKAAGFDDRGVVHTSSVRKFLTGRAPELPFHTVVADPPYDVDEASEVLALLVDGWLSAEAVLMWEQPSKQPALTWPEGLRDLGARVYGEARLNFAELPVE